MYERILIVDVTPLRGALDRIKSDTARGGAQRPGSFSTPVLLLQALAEKGLGVLSAIQGSGSMALI